MLLRMLFGLTLSLTPTKRVTYDVVTPPPPCDGCTIDAPRTRSGSLPLLVVLHGNNETARTATKRWRAAALARGWIVLGLQCPRSEGCDGAGRWYAWRGSPTWVTQQVQAIAKTLPIDPQRTYLAGWSGGATYVGMNAPAWKSAFAAIVIHGGGQPPSSEDCPAQTLPSYFLVGDQNPAHGAAKRLRAYLERCNQEVSWDLVPGADHEHEDAALDRTKATRILDWLEERARRPTVS